jgi:hypothetical protein
MAPLSAAGADANTLPATARAAVARIVSGCNDNATLCPLRRRWKRARAGLALSAVAPAAALARRGRKGPARGDFAFRHSPPCRTAPRAGGCEEWRGSAGGLAPRTIRPVAIVMPSREPSRCTPTATASEASLGDPMQQSRIAGSLINGVALARVHDWPERILWIHGKSDMVSLLINPSQSAARVIVKVLQVRADQD